ncbi:hypothetical protein D3C72_1803900 [compost metagenome]
MVKKLNTLAFTACRGFADVEHACPLAQEQAQIQRARIQHQPGMAIKVLIGERADLFMNGVFVAANAFCFADSFQRAEDRTDVPVQTPGVVPHAGERQFGFAEVHQPGDVARVFSWVFFF